MNTRSRGFFILALNLSLVAGCGGSSEAPKESADAATVDVGAATDVVADVQHVLPACAHDSRVQPYAIGMQGDGSSVRLRLDTVDPPPATRFNYAWTLEATDLAGAPLAGLTMTARPWMPDHGHGASVVPTVSELGDGHYSVANVDLFMAGVWTITFTIHLPSGDTDTAVFAVCIGD